MTDIQETTEEVKGSSQHVSLHEKGLLPDPILSDEGRRVLEIIFYVVLTGVISLLGSIANVINIVIFVKQGFSDSVNISLCGLAVSDMASLLPLLWKSICYNPLFQFSEIEFDSIQIQYLSAGWPHGCFAWITCWITAFITFERCVCIAMPMKVKSIITPTRTLFSIVVIFITMIAIVTPVFFCIYFAPLFQIERNKTLVGMAYFSNGMEVSSISHSITIAAQFIAVVIVVACTVTLIHHLIARSRWLIKSQLASSSSSSGTTDHVSQRDIRVMTMITFIACIFLACFIPSTATIILMVGFSSDFSVSGLYRNTFNVTWGIVNTIEAVNSSMNIIVYYNMSSKYRATFIEMFTKDFPEVK